MGKNHNSPSFDARDFRVPILDCLGDSRWVPFGAMTQPPPPTGDVHTIISRIRELGDLSPDQLDGLPFGAIGVDKSGVIFAFNAAEARLAELSAETVIGKNFFTDVAPCTNVEAFAERFRRGIEIGEFNVVFPFIFRFPDRAVNVWVTLFHESGADVAWIFVEQREQPASA